MFGNGGGTVTGSDKKDLIFGGSGADKIKGQSGDDILLERSGADSLEGGEGNDWLFGGQGADTFQGGSGNDRLFGGEGLDTADYRSATAGSGVAALSNITIAGAEVTVTKGTSGTDKLSEVESLIDPDGSTRKLTKLDILRQRADLPSGSFSLNLAEGPVEITLNNGGASAGRGVVDFNFAGSSDETNPNKYKITIAADTSEQLRQDNLIFMDGRQIIGGASIFFNKYEYINKDPSKYNCPSYLTYDEHVTYRQEFLEKLTRENSGLFGYYFIEAEMLKFDSNFTFGYYEPEGLLWDKVTLGTQGEIYYMMPSDGSSDGIRDTLHIEFRDGSVIDIAGWKQGDFGLKLQFSPTLDAGFNNNKEYEYFKTVELNRLQAALNTIGMISPTANIDAAAAISTASRIAALTGDRKLIGPTTPIFRAGGSSGDVLTGRAGNDVLLGEGGADSLLGNDGNDQLSGGADADTLDGGGGADSLAGGAGNDMLIGGAGQDIAVYSGRQSDYTITKVANWRYSVRDNRQNGSDGVDYLSDIEQIQFADRTVRLFSIQIKRPPDSLRLTGGSVAENAAAGTLVGTLAGHDPDPGNVLGYRLIDSAGGRFVVDATTGRLTVAAGAVLDFESTPNLRIKARVTDETGLSRDASFTISLINQSGTPIIGTAGADTLVGTDEEEVISGGAGNDRIISGAGADVLTGGAGLDTFVIAPGFGRDTIMDFGATPANQDLLQVSTRLFADMQAFMAGARQVGSDLVITATATDVLTLKNVTLASLDAADLRFTP